ncbi:MAG: sugar transferase [Oscillospiraceae bacterium]|nr:sugar transferase [Oscillospiraceae bacterium]
MNRKRVKGWLKHGDFILLDLLCMQFCFILSFWIFRGFHNPYMQDTNQHLAVTLFVAQLLVVLFSSSYQGILRRKKFDELIAVCKYIISVMLLVLLYLFVVHRSGEVSRLQFGFTAVFYVVLDFLLRQGNKLRIKTFSATGNRRSIVLVTSKRLVREAMERLTGEDTFRDYKISGIVLLDTDDVSDLEEFGIPAGQLNDEIVMRIGHGWVDEVFILQPDDLPFPTQLLDELMEMGITVNYSMSALTDDRWPITDLRKLGKYKVLTNSIRFAPAGEMALKRALDILGGLVGCLMTGIIFLFVAPAIYIKSPGPIFFTQERIGRNGKTFKMYKFRSMYLDAEERKAALMAQNKVKDGMMFKMDDDPRIIGSEKKDKNGKPKGIGNFIRNTSLDEFPQFFNVLKGDMSLVGWRPATLDEWTKYERQHRIRASMKPGLTGMWQVRGRSEITDFNEVVRLDREYIENWSMALDIKILIKTVLVVVTRHGAE